MLNMLISLQLSASSGLNSWLLGSFKGSRLPSLSGPAYLSPPLVLCLGQKEEGKVQGQLNHTDSSQYIRDLKSQITELKHEVSWGQSGPCSFLFCCVSYHWFRFDSCWSFFHPVLWSGSLETFSQLLPSTGLNLTSVNYTQRLPVSRRHLILKMLFWCL